MSDEKHTPGPWKTVRSPHGNSYLCVQIGLDEMYATLEMLPADALLIAAAPDLLAACEATAGRLRRFANDSPRQPGDLLDLLDAVIAKARGA